MQGLDTAAIGRNRVRWDGVLTIMRLVSIRRGWENGREYSKQGVVSLPGQVSVLMQRKWVFRRALGLLLRDIVQV